MFQRVTLRQVATCGLVLAMTASSARSNSLWIYNVHTGDELHLVDIPATTMHTTPWRRANRLWRSWRTQERRTVHPRLLRTLAHIQQHFGGRRIEISSGYRKPAQGDPLSSYHQVGRAADVKIRGVPKRVLLDYCRTLSRTGCGYYPNAEFVHVDVRGTSAIWVDLSPSGQPSDYVRNANTWLRNH